jgi:hypothetical protein
MKRIISLTESYILSTKNHHPKIITDPQQAHSNMQAIFNSSLKSTNPSTTIYQTKIITDTQQTHSNI